MADIYNSQLDAFDLYHKVREIAQEEYLRSHGPPGLPALGHAVAGSTASALSNVFTYPLDLIITRLQTQRQVQKAQSTSKQKSYQTFWEVASKIHSQEGGVAGFYAGIWEDTAKTVLDSFFFFLLYTFLREKRLASFAKNHNGKKPSLLPASEELGIGFVTGSLTRFATTPISNIVTRKQTGAMTSRKAAATENNPSADNSRPIEQPKAPSAREIVRQIYDEKGIQGFWSGYSASLILTLNPTLTFFLFEALKRLTLPRSKRDSPPASATFFLAAMSKAIASSVTYPFQLAKARMQASGGPRTPSPNAGLGKKSDVSSSSQSPPRQTTILHTLLLIVRAEGVTALYEGLPPELAKGFVTHGLTMLLKQSIHATILQLYLSLSHLVSSLRTSVLGTGAKTILIRRREEARNKSKDYYDMAVDRAGEVAEEAVTKLQQVRDRTVETVGEAVRTGPNAAFEKGSGLMQEVMEMANDTSELLRDYIDVGDGDDTN